MDINEFFRKEYLTVEELRALGIGGGIAVVSGETWLEEFIFNSVKTKVMFVKVELTKTKELRPLRLGTKGYPSQACRSLRQLFGGDTDSWNGKPIELFPVKYGEDKYTLGVKAYDLDVERVH